MERMIAMTRMPRVCLSLAVTALLALAMAPVAGALTLSAPAAHLSASGWLGAALHWVEDLAGLRPHGHHDPSGARAPVGTKDDTSAARPASGGCIDPIGHPRPCP